MAEKTPYAVVVFLIVICVLAYEVSSQNSDHRCMFLKCETGNCTRIQCYPCSDAIETDNPQTESDSQIEDVDDRDDTEKEDDDKDNDDSSEESGDSFDDRHIRRWLARCPSHGWCERKVVYSCYTCRTHYACCRGWKLNTETHTCSIREGQTTPAIDCMNGGTAVRGPRGPRCLCLPRYTGSRCEDAVCLKQCRNGGVCEVVNTREKCVCTEDFTGSRCQRPRCDGGCSRGYCMVSQGRTYCRCNKGWTGKNCDVKEVKKNGVCPPINALTTLGTCAETCKADSSCPDKMKCCFNGCGHMCSIPANFTCTYKNKNYKVGQVFNPDACKVCTCLSPDSTKPYGGAKCTRVVCPEMPNCTQIAIDGDSCCGYCADKPVQDDKYKKPTFVNCPKSLVILDVGPSDNEAHLPLTLKARDYKNNDLEVFVVKEVFKAGIGEDNFDTVVATTARDSHENYAYCQFHVRIRDVHAPYFTFCPPDVLMTKDGVADWEEPTAKDNVGLVRPPTSSNSPKDYFGKGEHLIVYTVEDYEGNIATCKFIVKISTFEFSRDIDRDMATDKRKYMYIGIGIALLVLVIIIVFLVVAVRSCRRHARRPQSEAASQPPSYQNTIYSIGPTAPPSYREKPPIYETIPRKKDLSEDCGKGVDNPTYQM